MKTELLPIGTEFEIQYPVSQTSTDTRAHVWRYRVKGHSTVQRSGNPKDIGPAETLEPISVRYRNITRIWRDSADLYGNPVLRAEFDGDPPSPTYEQALTTANA